MVDNHLFGGYIPLFYAAGLGTGSCGSRLRCILFPIWTAVDAVSVKTEFGPDPMASKIAYMPATMCALHLRVSRPERSYSYLPLRPVYAAA